VHFRIACKIAIDCHLYNPHAERDAHVATEGLEVEAGNRSAMPDAINSTTPDLDR
jgi:hypothetical protein